MTDAPFDATDMDARLSETVVLADHRLALGLQHRDGAGIRVCAWDGERLRHMSPAAAKRWAGELEDAPYAAAFRPVVDALRALAERALELEAAVAARRGGLAGMPVEGHA